MTNRRGFVLSLVTFVLVAAVFLWIAKIEKEPIYNGRSLGQWCEMIPSRSNYSSLNTQAVAAVRAVGTNAIPWLLKDLQTPGSVWQYKINQLLKKQSFIRWRFPDSGARLSRGVWGFQALGELGTPAIPDLERIITNTPGYVPGALAGIGHNAVPALCRALTNQHPYVPSNTAAYIANATSYGCLASNDLCILLPLMKDLSNSTNSHWAGRARGALHTMQANGQLEGDFAKYRPD